MIIACLAGLLQVFKQAIVYMPKVLDMCDEIRSSF